jgi:hypothetical protein
MKPGTPFPCRGLAAISNTICSPKSIARAILVAEPGDRDPARLMVLVDKVEDIIIGCEPEMRGNLCLVECQLPGAPTAAAFSTIFGIIDCLQRISLHFNLKDDCLKLIFVRRADGRQ